MTRRNRWSANSKNIVVVRITACCCCSRCYGRYVILWLVDVVLSTVAYGTEQRGNREENQTNIAQHRAHVVNRGARGYHITRCIIHRNTQITHSFLLLPFFPFFFGAISPRVFKTLFLPGVYDALQFWCYDVYRTAYFYYLYFVVWGLTYDHGLDFWRCVNNVRTTPRGLVSLSKARGAHKTLMVFLGRSRWDLFSTEDYLVEIWWAILRVILYIYTLTPFLLIVSELSWTELHGTSDAYTINMTLLEVLRAQAIIYRRVVSIFSYYQYLIIVSVALTFYVSEKDPTLTSSCPQKGAWGSSVRFECLRNFLCVCTKTCGVLGPLLLLESQKFHICEIISMFVKEFRTTRTWNSQGAECQAELNFTKLEIISQMWEKSSPMTTSLMLR